MAERSRAVVRFSLCCFLLHLSNLDGNVLSTLAAQSSTIIVTAYPGQDFELSCNVTSGIGAWRINNNKRQYSSFELFSGKVQGHNSSGNNLIVKDIMMNDPRSGYFYECWISTDNGISFALNTRFLLYVADLGSGEVDVEMTITPPAEVVSTIHSTNSMSSTIAPTTISTVIFTIIATTIKPTIKPTIAIPDVVVTTNSIGNGEASVVMITTPPVHIDTDDDVDVDNVVDDNVDNNSLLLIVLIVVVVVIICSCGCMHILFCYFCKRKERESQCKDNEKYYRIVHASILALGVFTCGTSVLLWWLYKSLVVCSSKDKYDVEDQSTNNKKSSKNLKGRKILPVSNGLTEHDKSETMTITSSSEVSYAVMSTKALSEETFIEPLPHYDYAALGARKIVGIHQTTANGAQQAVSTKVENTDTNGVQYAVCNIVPTKDVKKEKEGETDTQHQQDMEYPVMDKSKKKKKKGDKQQNKTDIQQQQQQGAMEYAVVDTSKKKRKSDKQQNEKLDAQQPQQPQGAMIYAVVDKTKKQQDERTDTQQQQQQGAMEYAVVDKTKKKQKGNKQQNGNMGIQQSHQIGEEIKEGKCADHNQKTELNYMSPSNLEFKEALGNRMRKFDVDHDVQYQEVVENRKYTSIL